MEADPFDSLLGLEDEYYNEGFRLGSADGTQAGLAEGRLFGLEKGFEKFVTMGKLHGRSIVWASRLPTTAESHTTSIQGTVSASARNGQALENTDSTGPRESVHRTLPYHSLPSLPTHARMEKHVRTFHALVELESISTQNNEDSVSNFDDRLKRASGKAKVIEKLIGEDDDTTFGDVAAELVSGGPQRQEPSTEQGGNIEDIDILHARH